MSRALRVHANGDVPEDFRLPENVEASAHFRQSLRWYQVHAEDHLLVGSFVDGVLVGRSVVRRLRALRGIVQVLRIERGPVAISPQYLKLHLKQLVDHFSSSGSIIQINPYTEDQSQIHVFDELLKEQGWQPADEPRHFYSHSVTVDLAPDTEVIQAGFRKSLRRNIRKAVNAGLYCEIGYDKSHAKQLIELYNETAKVRGFEPLSSATQDYVHQEVHNQRMATCVIFVDEAVAGGNLIVPFGKKVLLEWGAFSQLPAHRRHPLAHLADWETILWARETGFETLDFSGYWLDRGDADPINHYKSGFSKQVITVMPEYDYSNLSPWTQFLTDIARSARIVTLQAKKLTKQGLAPKQSLK